MILYMMWEEISLTTLNVILKGFKIIIYIPHL